MLYSRLDSTEEYQHLGGDFKAVFAFLKEHDLAALEVGRYPISDTAWIAVQHYTTDPAHELPFETHDNYYDLQFVIEGTEALGVAFRDDLEDDGAYNAEKDVTFYKEPSVSGNVILRAGDFALVGPADAHRPRSCAGIAMPIKKIVGKIKVV
ncbi:MAG: YhcH/YjgK/YiaL family protein [Ruthenibacterium sp.]